MRTRWPSWEALADRLQLFALHGALYRLLGGRVVGRNILLLGTVGRRSGTERRTPLYFARAGEDYLIVASNGGDERYPGWWYNIRSNPRVKVQDGRRVRECSAHEVGRDEAEVLWPRLFAVYGGYRRYREQTRRPLTMFRLHPLGTGGAGMERAARTDGRTGAWIA